MGENNNDKYDLYTEHIVPNIEKKAKKLITRGVYTLVFAAIFGLIAGLVMIIVVQKGKMFFSQEPTETVKLGANDDTDESEDIKVSVPDESDKEEPTKPVLEWDEELESQLNNLNSGYEVLKVIANKVNTYSATIKKKNNSIVPTGLSNSNQAYGIVVAESVEHFYILTDNSFINMATEYEVEYYNGGKADMEFVASDATTGFAIVRTLKNGLDNIKIASLGKSSNLSKGDLVVAVGELYGFPDSMGYGMITGANVAVSDTDSEFMLIATDIIGSPSSFGVISNTRGNVIGIITTNYNTGTSNHISAYAIDEVTGIIEKLMNGKKASYLGIRGISVIYGKDSKGNDLTGIYVSSIEVNSPAYYAGLQPGDIITSVGKKKTATMDIYMEALYAQKQDSATEIRVKRKGREQYKEIVFQVVLGVE